ncbi:hypothetical protein E2C01_028649 [Portunus trituberculatus]|uniref:Uncharacterized protein n=1 Tax=Portunus trituberculatus TaxID=210409 RepID=A0A5B7EL06_PORTR|nr:hypothetical protein [Portunus trituberculatus]
MLASHTGLPRASWWTGAVVSSDCAILAGRVPHFEKLVRAIPFSVSRRGRQYERGLTLLGLQYTAGNRQSGGRASNAMVNGGNLQCAHCRREPNRREAGAADWQAGCWPPVHSTSMSVDGPCQVRLGATGLTRAFQSEAQSWCSATAQHGSAAPPCSSPRLGCQGEEGRAQATRRVAGT